MTTTGGGEVQKLADTIVSVQVSLARIEEALKQLTSLTATVNEIKDVSREALSSAQQANAKIVELEVVVHTTREVADEAKRKAEAANKQLAMQAEGQKWVRRTFYGAVIAAAGGGVAAAVWAAITMAGS